MKRLMMSAVAVIAVLIAATTVLRSHQSDPAEEAVAMMPMQELHAAAARSRLPIQHFEDMSLVFTSGPGR